MRTSFSRRELYALGEMLGDGVTRKEGGRIIYGGGGGGGRAAPTETTQTSYNTNVPEYARPYVETMLQGTQKQLFQTAPNATTGATEITGFQPYKAYGGTYDAQGNQTSYDPGKAVAGFQPMQESAQRGIAGMQMPGEYKEAADVTRAGITAAMGNQYQGGQFDNQFGPPPEYRSGRFAAQQVNAPYLQDYQMQGPANVQGSQAQAAQLGASPEINAAQFQGPGAVGYDQAQAERVNAPQLRDLSMQAAGNVDTQSFNQPGSASQYMSPYMQNVVDIQQREAQRQADIAGTQRAGQAVKSGAFGGSRAGLMEAEAARNLATQKGDIQATGQQAAFQNAQQQFNTEQNAKLQANLANQQTQQQANVQNLSAGLQTQGLGAQTGLTAQQLNQATGLQANLANQQAGINTGQFNANMGYNTGMQNAQMRQQAAMANQGLAGQFGLQQGQFGQAANLQNAQMNQQANLANQQMGYNVGQQNLASRLQTQGLGSGQNMQAQLANQQQGMNAQQMREQSRQFGAGQQMTAAQQKAQYGLAGQQLGEQSRQFGANYGMQNLQAGMQGAQQLAGLGQAQLGAQQGIYNLQNTVGAQQQALEQQKINQAMTDYANAQQYPLMQLGTMSNMLRGLPMQAQTTNQYAAAPNQMTQAIGTAGAAASLYNALRAKGGVIKEKRMAIGGITSVPSYDVGGEVYADLMKMGPDELQKQIKSSSSEKVKEMAKSLLKQKQMAGGGIVAFAKGDTVEEDYFGSAMQKPASDWHPGDRQENLGVPPNPQPPAPAPPAPAGITQAKPPEPTTGVGTLQATRETLGQDYNKPMTERIAEKQAMYKEMGVGAPGAEQREKLMAERANAADEAERTKWMRAAKFFASWGSTPGSTLVAGMTAVRESVPDMINDAKEAKKIRMEMDKTIAGLDEATRLEKKGFVDEAYAEKMKLGEKMQALNIEIAKIQAQQELEDKKTLRGEKHDERMLAGQKELEGLRAQNAKDLENIRVQAGKYERGDKDKDRAVTMYSAFTTKAQMIEKGILDTINKDGGAYQNAMRDSKMDPTKSANAKQQVDAAKETLRVMDEGFKKMRDDVAFTQNLLESKLGLQRPKTDTTNKPKGGAAPPPPPGAKLD